VVRKPYSVFFSFDYSVISVFYKASGIKFSSKAKKGYASAGSAFALVTFHVYRNIE